MDRCHAVGRAWPALKQAHMACLVLVWEDLPAFVNQAGEHQMQELSLGLRRGSLAVSLGPHGIPGQRCKQDLNSARVVCGTKRSTVTKHSSTLIGSPVERCATGASPRSHQLCLHCFEPQSPWSGKAVSWPIDTLEMYGSSIARMRALCGCEGAPTSSN